MKKSQLAPLQLHKYLDDDWFADKNIPDGTFTVTKDVKGRERLTIMLPQTPEWCTHCRAAGGRSVYDKQGLDIDKMMEDDEDGSFRRDYFSGRTDEPCEECNGSGIMTVIDHDALTDVQRMILDENAEYYRADSVDRRYSEQERRAGA